jgi:hypothetical protein
MPASKREAQSSNPSAFKKRKKSKIGYSKHVTFPPVNINFNALQSKFQLSFFLN